MHIEKILKPQSGDDYCTDNDFQRTATYEGKNTMTSLGEADIEVNSNNIGRIRVMDFHAPPALEPRLVFRFGATFTVRQEWMIEKRLDADALALHAADGELALPDGRFIGSLEWVGPRVPLRSASYYNEVQFQLAC